MSRCFTRSCRRNQRCWFSPERQRSFGFELARSEPGCKSSRGGDLQPACMLGEWRRPWPSCVRAQLARGLAAETWSAPLHPASPKSCRRGSPAGSGDPRNQRPGNGLGLRSCVLPRNLGKSLTGGAKSLLSPSLNEQAKSLGVGAAGLNGPAGCDFQTNVRVARRSSLKTRVALETVRA